MYCLRCGTKVEESTKYCPHCGANIQEEMSRYNYQPPQTDHKDPVINLQPTHEEQFNYSKNYSKSKDKQQNKDQLQKEPINIFKKNFNYQEEEYLKAYVKNNYEKIKHSKISIPTIILGPFYLFYRKLYLLGTIWIILLVITTEHYNIYLGATVILSILFNTIYFNHSLKKIKYLTTTFHGLDHEAMLKLCRKKGGVNIFVPIILIGILIGAIIMVVYENMKPELLKEKEDTTYTRNALTYTIPKGFYPLYENESKHFSHSSYYNDDYCSITIETTANANYYQDELDYINKIILSNDRKTNSNITNTTINNNIWTVVESTTEYDNQTYYIIKSNNTIYNIETLDNYYNTETCQSHFQKTIASLNIK